MSRSHLGEFFDFEVVGGNGTIADDEANNRTVFTYTGGEMTGSSGLYITLKDTYNYNIVNINANVPYYLNFNQSSPMAEFSDFVNLQDGIPVSEQPACVQEWWYTEQGHSTLANCYLSSSDVLSVNPTDFYVTSPSCPLYPRKFRFCCPYNYTRPVVFYLSVDPAMFMEATTPQFWRSFVRTVEIYE